MTALKQLKSMGDFVSHGHVHRSIVYLVLVKPQQITGPIEAHGSASGQRRTGRARQPTKRSVEAAATAQMQKKKARKA